jgi:penicillin-binding protein 2
MEIRFKILQYSILIFFLAIFLRLCYLQLFQGKIYLQKSEENRLRLVEEDPVRGVIYDRKGRVLVENIPIYSLVAYPSGILNNPQTLASLRTMLAEPANNEWETTAQKNIKRQENIRLKRDLNFPLLASIEENMLFLPGIEVKVEAKRSYPYQTATHILGYLGEINSEELSQFKKFQAGDIVGKKGIEEAYNTELFGQKGFRVFEVDASGDKIRDIPQIRNLPSRNGDDIYLTIDLDLQLLAEELLAGKKGAVVALDPNNGEILLMASSPAYNPSILSGVINPEQWKALINNPDKPLLNRVLQGQYPPGSTIKMAILAAALEEGVATINRTAYCPGYLTLGDRTFKCWRADGHGNIKTIPALEQSCDVFFYKIGFDLGVDTIAKYLRKFGFGSKTGIDLNDELKGLVPDSSYMNRKYGRNGWSRGNALNIAIGQGDLLVTPLQLLLYGAAIANRGLQPQPHLLKGLVHHNPDKWVGYKTNFHRISGISEKTLEILRKGMFEVVQGNSGTAHWLMDQRVAVAGKTGTAQNPQGDDHAWFIGFAPYDNPQIIVCALVEFGKHGSSSAAPIVFTIIRRYLNLEIPETEMIAGEIEE